MASSPDDKFWDRLARMAGRICRNVQDARDVIEEAKVKVALYPVYPGKPVGEGLIVTMVRGLARDKRRRKKTRDAYLQHLKTSKLLSGVADDSRVIELADLMCEVYRIRDSLTPSVHGQILKKFFQDGLSREEICKSLNMKDVTFRVALFRAIENLRGRLVAAGLMDLLREELR